MIYFFCIYLPSTGLWTHQWPPNAGVENGTDQNQNVGHVQQLPMAPQANAEMEMIQMMTSNEHPQAYEDLNMFNSYTE
jgi:hypothetical protein